MYVSVCCVHTYAIVCMWSPEDAFHGLTPSTLEDPGIELRSSAFVAEAFSGPAQLHIPHSHL